MKSVTSLYGEVFYTLNEDRIIIESWRRHYNTRPVSLIVELPTAGPRGPAMAGCTIRTSFAGHPEIEAEASDALTYNPDHLLGAGQVNKKGSTTRRHPLN